MLKIGQYLSTHVTSGWYLELHAADLLVVSVHVLVDDELVVAERHLGAGAPLLRLLHELPQLRPLVPHLLGEVLRNVDVAARQELGFPENRFQ